MNIKFFFIYILMFLLLINCSCVNEVQTKKSLHYKINTIYNSIEIIPFYLINNDYKSIYKNYIFGIFIKKIYADGKEIKKEFSYRLLDDYGSLQLNLDKNEDYVYYVNIFNNNDFMGSLYSDNNGVLYQYNIQKNIRTLKIIYEISLPNGKRTTENTMEINFNVR